MVISLRNIEEARKAGVTDQQIVQSISRNEETLSDGIGRATDAGIPESDILRRLMSQQERGTISDVATQAVTAPLTAAATGPRPLFDTVDFAKNVMFDTKNTVRNLITDFLGLPPQQAEEPKETLGGRIGQLISPKPVKDQDLLGFMFGEKKSKEVVQKFDDITGIGYVKEKFGNIIDSYADLKKDNNIFAFEKDRKLEGESFSEFFRRKYPNREVRRKQLSNFLDIDLDPQKPLGKIAEKAIGSFIENTPIWGPKISKEMSKAAAAGQTAREAGFPEPVANMIEVGSLVLQGKRPPAKEVVKKGVEVTEKELVDFSKNLKKPQSAIEDLSKPPKTPSGPPLPPETIPPTTPPSDLAGRPTSSAAPLKPINFNEPMRTTDIIKTIEAETKGPLLNTLAPAVDIEVGLERVGGAINEQFTRARGKTSNLYEETAQTIGETNNRGIHPSTISAIDAKIADIERSGIPGTGKQTVINELESLRNFLEDGVDLRDSIKREQQFSNLFDFDFPDLESRAKASQFVKPIRKIFVEENYNNLKAVNRPAFVTLRKAKLSHQNSVERFGKDSVIKLQRGESSLDSRNTLKRPQDVSAFKSALGEKSLFNPVLDRLVLEELDAGNLAGQTTKDLNLMKKRLTPRGQDILDELSNLADPKNLHQKNLTLQARILDDVNNAHLHKTLPKVTLDLMENPQTYDIVRSTLSRNAAGRAAFKNMENLFIRNTYDNLFKGTELDVKAAQDLVNNRQLFNQVKRMSPDDAKIIEMLSDVATPPVKAPPVKVKIEPPKPGVVETLTNSLEKTILEDAVKNKILGKSPDKTLELMKTPEGLRQVRRTLNPIPGGKELLKEIEASFVDKTFKDLFKNGKMDLKKAKSIAEDKKLIESISKVNPEAAKMLKRLPEFIEKAENSLKSLGQRQIDSIKNNREMYVGGLLLLKALHVPLGSLALVVEGSILAANLLPKLLKNVEVTRLLKVIEKNPNAIPSSLAKLTKIVDKEENK